MTTITALCKATKQALSSAVALLLLLPAAAPAGELRVATAASFAPALETLRDAFTATTGHTLVVARGSTGKLYAQIVNGAPFDIYFAADAARPLQLEAAGRANAASGAVYAVGQLVLWSPNPREFAHPRQALLQEDYRYLAIANPRHAPYGIAAQQTLTSLGLWAALEPRLVRGENVGQALQFVRSGNAELGFIAAAQLAALANHGGSVWVVPQHLYEPLIQRVAVLRDSAAARDLLLFLQGELAQDVLRSYGYRLPAQLSE